MLLHYCLFLSLARQQCLLCIQLTSLLPTHTATNMPNLSVAMYKPAEGNHLHWALHLGNGAGHSIYKVLGEHPHFKPNFITGKKPDHAVRHQRSIFVYEISSTKLPGFKEAIACVKPQNDVVHWNCQDYVIEVLEYLEEQCIIDGEDQSYLKAKKEVEQYFEPPLERGVQNEPMCTKSVPNT